METAKAHINTSSGERREFAFTDSDFRQIVKLAYEQAGISLADSKKNLVYGRLARRLRALGMQRFEDYRAFLLSDNNGNEFEHFINSLTTNLTRLFREEHHFHHLADYIQTIAKAQPVGQKRFRVWSSACSTGEEAYSIALTLMGEGALASDWDTKILATDIDSTVLAKAAAGRYDADAIAAIPEKYRKPLDRNSMRKQPGNGLQMPQSLKDAIRFKRLNLLEHWPMRGPFDAIFCRNVMIYFDGPTKTQLIERFAGLLRPGGYLYVGHSEVLMGAAAWFRPVGKTVYQRLEQ